MTPTEKDAAGHALERCAAIASRCDVIGGDRRPGLVALRVGLDRRLAREGEQPGGLLERVDLGRSGGRSVGLDVRRRLGDLVEDQLRGVADFRLEKFERLGVERGFPHR
jgi:hypothetical protein